MPQLERWEEKAIGRVIRFQNTVGETVSNLLYEGKRAAINGAVQGTLDLARGGIGVLLNPTKKQTIKNKTFREDLSAGQVLLRKGLVGTANMGLDAAANTANAYYTRDYFYPAGSEVASTAFGGRVVFDEVLSRNMFNACGYAPDFSKVLKGLHDTAAGVDLGLSDGTWRRELTPYLIQTAFQEELEKSFAAIQAKHLENPGVYNRRLMKQQMDAAARHLGGIFEKFSLDLANNTDYLEAPLSLFPKKAPEHKDVQMNKDERKLLGKVARYSLLGSERDLNKRLEQAMKKSPRLSPQEAYQKLKHTLDKPVLDKDGKETLYRPGVNWHEDRQRLATSLLTLQEMKQRNESRNIFSRYFSKESRAEQAAIRDMQLYIQEILDVSVIRQNYLLKEKPQPEKDIELHELMGYELKGPTKSFTEKTVEAVQQTITNVVSDIGDKLSDAIMGEDFMADFNPFEDADELDELFGAQPIPRSKPQPPVNVPKENEPKQGEPEKEEPDKEEEPQKEEPKAEEQPQAGSTGWAGMLWNGVKYVGSLANPLNYIPTGLFGGKKPAQEVPVQSIAEESAEKPTEESAEESAEEAVAEPMENSGEKAEAKAANADGAQPAQAQAEEEAALEHVPDAEQKILDKQQEIIRQLNGEKLSYVAFYAAVAKLLYCKTLELSLNDGTLNTLDVEESLSEESMNAAAKKIQDEKAFFKVDKLAPSSMGKRSRAAFIAELTQDPSAINAVHKEYMQKLQAEKAPAAPKSQEAPAKAPAVNGPPPPMA